MPICSKDLRQKFEEKSKLITLGVFSVDVIVLIIVLIVLWGMPEPEIPGKDCGYMCLQCTTDVNKMCCGCRDEILNKYIQQTFDKKYQNISKEYEDMFKSREVKMHDGNMGDVKPVAHVVGEVRDKPSEDDLKRKLVLPIRKWYRGKNCLLLNGMSLHRGRFRVPVTGHYHVYSVIDFNYQLIRDSEHNTIHVYSNSSCLRHAIFKSNIKSKDPKELMVTHHPYEMSKNLIFARYDTYISGDVHLEAGDEVYVKVANISYASSPPKNVFGIHLI